MPIHKVVKLKKKMGRGAVLMRKRGGINSIVRKKEIDNIPYKESVKILGGRLKMDLSKKGYIKI
jgi:hypothetical protein